MRAAARRDQNPTGACEENGLEDENEPTEQVGWGMLREQEAGEDPEEKSLKVRRVGRAGPGSEQKEPSCTLSSWKVGTGSPCG